MIGLLIIILKLKTKLSLTGLTFKLLSYYDDYVSVSFGWHVQEPQEDTVLIRHQQSNYIHSCLDCTHWGILIGESVVQKQLNLMTLSQ